MEITQKNDEGTIVLSLSGKLLAGKDTAVLEKIISTTLRTGHRDVVLDLTELTYIDSSGIGELVNCHNIVTGKKGTLKLQNIPKTDSRSPRRHPLASGLRRRAELGRVASLTSERSDPPRVRSRGDAARGGDLAT